MTREPSSTRTRTWCDASRVVSHPNRVRFSSLARPPTSRVTVVGPPALRAAHAQLSQWIEEGVFGALDLGYLRMAIFSIYNSTKVQDSETLHEC